MKLSKKSLVRDAKNISELTKEQLEHLAFLSSWLHKNHWSEKPPKYLGLKHEYKGKSVDKDLRRYPNTKFHVVRMYSNNQDKEFGQLDRVFVVDYQMRNVFQIYNIMPNGTLSREVNIWQDDLFQMHKYLVQQGYEIKSK